MYLLLSTMTALLECGPIFLGICLGYGPGRILSFCLAYQFGNLFPVPFCLRRKTLFSTIYFSLAVLCLAEFSHKFPLLQWILYLLGIMLLSCTTQSIRAAMKNRTSTVKKRTARVIGFLLAPLMGYAPFFLLNVCCFIVLLAISHISEKNIPANHFVLSCKTIRKDRRYKIMLWHQLHYFIYAYAMIILVYQTTNRPFFTMLLFACTWLTYLSTEPLLSCLQHFHHASLDKLPSTHRITFTILGGHTFLLLILLLLPNTKSFFQIILWLLTGFGGGTVFAITSLCKRSAAYQKEQLEFTENIGHFTGTALALIWALLFPQSMSDLSYLSAFCVIMVIILTFKNRNENP